MLVEGYIYTGILNYRYVYLLENYVSKFIYISI